MEQSRYEIALEEYLNDDINGQHRLIYAYFGLAIYYCQCLEETFTIMLWTHRIFKKRAKTNKEVNEIINAFENSKKTMGMLLKELKQCYRIPQDTIDDLNKILETRNFLIHNYFKVEIQKVYSDVGRKEMINFFCDFTDQTKTIDDQLKSYYRNYTDRLGLTEERINEMVNEMKIQEQKRDTT
jgi:hypothetical protein